MGSGQELDKFVADITAKIGEIYRGLKNGNERLARVAAEEAIQHLYADLANRVETKQVASFKDFEIQRKAVHKQVGLCMYVCVCICVWVCGCVHTHTHTRTLTRIHARAHTHTHADI
jgi:hypothetical protein